jgi:hypothetical protein
MCVRLTCEEVHSKDVDVELERDLGVLYTKHRVVELRLIIGIV